jgi:hypothetical protein
MPAPYKDVDELLRAAKGMNAEDIKRKVRTNRKELLLPGHGIDITETAQAVFSKLLETDEFFLRDGKIFTVNLKYGTKEFRLVTAQEFRSILERYFSLKRKGKKGTGRAICTGEDAQGIMVNDERYQLPYVSRLLQCPVIDGEGKICSKGYHPQINEGTYITDGESEQVESLQTAIDDLSKLVKGYRFTSPADKTRALAMMITPALIQGGLIDGLIPAGVSEADLIGSGKTLWQTVLAAVYNDSPVVITQQRGGVGSMDENICSGLITGRAFVQLDNLRYKLDSTVLETLLTSPNHSLSVRVPHRGLMTVSTKGLSIYITSNGVQTTDDQADRSCFVRILKQPDGYPFEVYPEGGILKHVRANQGHYLGCVHRILQEWIARGKSTTNEARHRFTEWAQTVDWIMANLFDRTDLMEGHVAAQQRTANPFMNKLRDIALVVKRLGMLGNSFRASSLIELAADNQITIDGDTDEKKQCYFGRMCGGLFKDTEHLLLDDISMHRSIETELNEYGSNREVKTYSFTQKEAQTDTNSVDF